MDSEAPTKRRKDAHLWEQEEHHWYVEPAFAVEALFNRFPFVGNIYDPACGGGNILEVANRVRPSGYHLVGSDVVDRRDIAARGDRTFRFFQADFVASADAAEEAAANLCRHGIVHNIISNPPYKHGRAFVEAACRIATERVAMLFQQKFLSSIERHGWFRSPLTRPSHVLILSRRPSMLPGHVLAAGEKAGGGFHDYCWIVWDRRDVKRRQTIIDWVK